MATSASSTSKDVRGPELKDLELDCRSHEYCTFHDQQDFIFEGKPGNVWDSLQQYNEEYFEGKMVIDHVTSKHIKLFIKAEEQEEHDIVIKVKFYKHESNQLLVHFARKSGNIMRWYDIFKNMKEATLDYLLSPNI